MSEFFHISVLLHECLDGLNIKPDGIYVDGTLGGAGHSSQIAARLTTGRLIGIDRDPVALKAAGERLAPYQDRVTLVHSNFCEVKQILQDLEIPGVDGILLDLGVSSPQLDDGARGFSYMADAPLDMRMNSGDALNAHTVVNTWPYEELKRILYDYGEERYAPQIASAICRRREAAPIETTLELVDVIRSAMPASALREKQHPAKRSFQAIRIAVNDELGSVEKVMTDAVECLNPGGDYLPLSGRPHREKRYGGSGQRLHLPAQFPGVCMRQEAESKTDFQKTHCSISGRAGCQPQIQKRQASGLRKTVTQQERGAEYGTQTGIPLYSVLCRHGCTEADSAAAQKE